MKLNKTLGLFFAGLLLSIPAHAYVDPGTGSMAVQMIVGGLLAAGFMLKTYFYKVKRSINRMLGRESSADAELDSADTAEQADEQP